MQIGNECGLSVTAFVRWRVGMPLPLLHGLALLLLLLSPQLRVTASS